MENNKHPHHDLIVEWAKDTSKQVETKTDMIGWMPIKNPEWRPECKYRFKPRKFVKGHWYPCLGVNGVSVNMWDGEGFTLQSLEQGSCYPAYFHGIGESLGEINFGGGDDG